MLTKEQIKELLVSAKGICENNYCCSCPFKHLCTFPYHWEDVDIDDSLEAIAEAVEKEMSE